jgi:hypothetical protein
MRNDIPYHWDINTPINRECLIDGKKIPYDFCATNMPLEYAKAFYFSCEYLGTGKVYFINGTRNESKNLTHFFKQKIK